MSKDKVKYEKVKCVPWMVCPLCKGSGQTLAPGCTNSIFVQCDVCRGEKIIPMAIVPEDFTDHMDYREV